MKIDLNNIDQSEFLVHTHVLNGETVYLVQPAFIGAKWTQANKHFRSSVWNDEGELVSAGFPKFVNWGENPENFPVPESLKNTTVVEKIDGSLLIVSKYKGKIILRTRGTVDAHKLDNGYELDIFEATYLPKLMANDSADTWDYSYLFEWVSPVNRIILGYGGEPEWYLVGGIEHKNYSLWEQVGLDNVAAQYGLKRPTCYTFPTLSDLMSNVEQWKGKEGVVIYSNHGQTPHKKKGFWYISLHRMKEALASLDKVIDVWYEQGEPSYEHFENFIVSQFDWELWQQVRGDVSRICDAAKDANRIIEGMRKYVNETLLPMGDPKDKVIRGKMARQVIASYGITNRANFVFTLLDGKLLGTEDRKKLLYQVLKK